MNRQPFNDKPSTLDDMTKKRFGKISLNEMPNKGGLIETDSVRHFFNFDSWKPIHFSDGVFLSNAVLNIACLGNAPKRVYGQTGDSWDLSVKRH